MKNKWPAVQKRRRVFAALYLLVLLATCFTGWRYASLAREQARGDAFYQRSRATARDELPSLLQQKAPQLPSHCRQVQSLERENPDVVGWIALPGTPVDYPVVQGEDNQQYLHRLPDGTRNRVGSIFLDYRCDADSRNLILYGHNMRDDTMFGSLRRYLQPEFAQRHPAFYFYSTDRMARFDVFSVYTTEAEDGPYQTDFASPEDYAAFAERIQAAARYPLDVPLTVDDKVLTLSTCTDGGRTERLIVHGRLVEE